MSESKFIEQELSEDLKGLLRRGITELQGVSGEFESADVVKLEKLTRIYSILMADLRETVKHGLFSALDDSELDDLSQ